MFRRLLIVMTCLAIASTVFSTAVITFIRSEWEKDMRVNQDAYISGWMESVDSALNSSANALLYLSRSPEITKRSVMHYRVRYPDYLKLDKEIIEQIKTASLTTVGATDILLYWYDSNYMYSKSGVIDVDVYFANRFEGEASPWHTMLRSTYNAATLKTLQLTKRPLGLEGGTSLFSATPEIYMLQTMKSSTGVPVGTMCIGLEEDILSSIFTRTDFSEKREIYILDADDNLILSNAGADRLKQLRPHADNLTNESLFIDGRGLVSRYFSKFGDLEYIVFTDSSVMLKTLNRSFAIALVVEVFVIALLLLCSVALSRRLSMPFQRLLHVMGAPQNARAKNEVEYLTSRVLELIQSNKAMTSTVSDSSHIVLQAVLYKTIMGAPSLEEALTVADGYRANRLAITESFYQAAVLRMDLPTEQDEMFHLEHWEQFSQILRDHLDDWLVDVLDTRLDEYTLVLCLRQREEEEKVLQSLSRALEACNDAISSSSFYVGMGDIVESIQMLKTSYDSGMNHLRRRAVQDTNLIFTQDAQGVGERYLPSDMEARISDMLARRQDDQLSSYIQGILDANWKANVDYETYLLVCRTISDFLTRIGHLPKSEADFLRLPSTRYVYSARNCDEALMTNLRRVLDTVQAPPEANADTPPLTAQLQRYMEEHYMDNINLNLVADAFGYSPSYISRIFKNQCGVNFTDYLNARRVTAAKELLFETNKTIKEIAQETGLNSATLLIRVFEKYENCTPGEWRRTMKQQQRGIGQ